MLIATEEKKGRCFCDCQSLSVYVPGSEAGLCAYVPAKVKCRLNHTWLDSMRVEFLFSHYCFYILLLAVRYAIALLLCTIIKDKYIIKQIIRRNLSPPTNPHQSQKPPNPPRNTCPRNRAQDPTVPAQKPFCLQEPS